MAAIPVIPLDHRPRPAYIAYGFAVFVVLLTLFLRMFLTRYLRTEPSTYLAFFLPVVVSSWFGGLRSGLLATALSVLAVHKFILVDNTSVAEQAVSSVLFSLEASLVSYLIEGMKVSGRSLAGIVQSINDGFAVLDWDWRFLYVNEKGARMARASSNELVGQTLWERFPQAIGTEFGENLHKAVREDRPINSEYYIAPLDRWFEYSIYPSRGGLTVFARDITERRKSREELEAAKGEIERMNAELELRVQERTAQLNATIGELEAFSYSVSHDLRAPLRAIDGFSKMLDEDYHSKLDAEGRRIIDVIRNSTVRMGHLVDGLLGFSRLGRQPMGSSEIDMTELVRETRDEVRQPESHRHLDFNIAGLPPATGDRVLMRQVFINLLSNALKFTRDRDPAVIEVGAKTDGEDNVFYVKDNGVGFDMRYADKLFGVFQRLHGVNEFEGTGLGLAIVQRIVHRHGGRVWAEGAVGHGATIYFSLPKVKAKETRRSA